MIKSYFISAIRQIAKNKIYFLINMVGLSIGISASLLAYMFVVDESSFDNFHSKANRIYRLNKIKVEQDGALVKRAESSGMMGPAMLEEFPEIENVVRYQPSYNETVLYRDSANVFLEEGELVFADNSFLDVFDYKLIEGSTSVALSRPSTILLTPLLAKSLFGDDDPIGRIVTGFNNVRFEVTGIIEPAPRNSHQQFKAIASWTTTTPGIGPLGYSFMNNWIAQTISTYILIKEGASATALQVKFPEFMKEHMPDRVDMYRLYLQPLSEVYLGSSDVFGSMVAKVGNRQYLFIFSIVAGFILLIACVNYININTSKATRRAREVGMRKSLGATKYQLVQQFLGESFLITVLSGMLALLLVDLFIPFFNSLSGKSLTASLLLDGEIVAGLFAIVFLVSVLSGVYPALVLSAFRPSEVLKASSKSKLTGNLPRQVLIVFQFVISMALIAGTIVVERQVRYVLSRDLGFDKDQIIVLPLTDNIKEHLSSFTEEVKTHSSVKQVSISRDAIGKGFASTMVVPEGLHEPLEVKMVRVDANFDETFGLSMAEGRFFDYKLSSDSGAFIVNESFVKHSGWTDPLTKVIRFEGDTNRFNVIGVLKDFNYSSLKSEVEPLVMWIEPRRFSNAAIKFEGGKASDLLSFLNNTWEKFEDRYPFDYTFLDQNFASMYESEEKLSQTVLVFSAISILIASLGLYGLVSFTMEQRTKEIGIRKVLGASILGLTVQINRPFIILVALSAIVAIPGTYFIISKWLGQFAYHIEVSPTAFLIAVLTTLLITVSSVCAKALIAAQANPVKALRQE